MSGHAGDCPAILNECDLAFVESGQCLCGRDALLTKLREVLQK